MRVFFFQVAGLRCVVFAAQMSTKVQIKSNVEIIARVALSLPLYVCVRGGGGSGVRVCVCVLNVLVIWLVAPA